MGDTNDSESTGGTQGGGAGDDAALLAELTSGAHEKEFGKAAKDGKAKKPAAKEEGDSDEESVADDAGDDKEEETGAKEGEEEEDDDEDGAGDKKTETDDDDDEEEGEDDVELDAATKKRLAAVQRAEKQAKERLSAERAKVEQLVAEWKPKIEKAARFEQLAARAKYAAADVLEELGLGPDDFEPVARELYARSSKGLKDPKLRDAAARSAREREKDKKLEDLEKRYEDLEKKYAEREKQSETQAAVDGYLDKVAQAAEKVGDAPLVKHMLTKTPKKARGRLLEVANQLADELGEVPTAADVIRELERRRRAELEEDGIDPAKVLGISPSESEGRTEKKGARTLKKGGGGSAGAGGEKKYQNRDEEFEDLKKEILAGNLADT